MRDLTRDMAKVIDLIDKQKNDSDSNFTPIHKIAVLRANALGDFIFILPALAALRAMYPRAEIVLLAKSWHASFLANRPSPVDRVVVIPSYPGVGAEPDSQVDEAAIEDFFQLMGQEHFDLAIQIHGGGHYSNPFVRRLQAGTTIGLTTPDAEALDLSIPYIYFQPEILRYLEVVSLVGAAPVSPVSLDPHITITSSDKEEAGRFLPATGQPLVVLHPGASDVRRRWPTEKFAEVGDALAAIGAHVVVTGGKEEQDLTSAVVHTMHNHAHDLCNRLSLGGLAGLLERARVVISNDTGPLHLAHAVGSKTVGIFWAYNVMTAAPLTRNRHRPVVTWNMHCPLCGNDNSWQPCEHRVSFVDSIPTKDVIGPALELFTI